MPELRLRHQELTLDSETHVKMSLDGITDRLRSINATMATSQSATMGAVWKGIEVLDSQIGGRCPRRIECLQKWAGKRGG
jgi:hypothetical protein